MRKKWYALIAIVIIIAGYSVFHYIRYSPHLNPHPQYFVTIKGTVSPELQDKIRFYMRYATRAKRCEHQGFNVNYSSARADKIKPRFNNKNEFSIVVPLDKYKPGWCEWNASDFGYYFIGEKYKNYQYAVGFDDNTDPYFPNASKYFSKKNQLDFSCSIGKEMFGDHYINSMGCNIKNSFEDDNLLKPSRGNYSLTFNFSGDKHAKSN